MCSMFLFFVFCYKNKILMIFLVIVFGSIGLYCFYFYGGCDCFGWLYILVIFLLLVLMVVWLDVFKFFIGLFFVLLVLIVCLEVLVFGFMLDDKWDVCYNVGSSKNFELYWILVLILVLMVGLGVMGVIVLLVCSFDLFFIGGVFGWAVVLFLWF